MQITRQADYAVRAVLYLAKMGNNERAATSTVAKEQNIPPSFLAKIISQVIHCRSPSYIARCAWRVTLARDAKDITLLEVVEAIDGPIQLNECVGSDGGCHFDEDCPIKPVWCDAQEELVNRLKGTNFGDLIAQKN